jgi:hypothetical protein
VQWPSKIKEIQMPQLKLLRETAWIKEWETPWGVYVDSKLRWLGVEPSAAAFMAAWDAASPHERWDLEAAFEFYPYELEEDIESILSHIGVDDADRAASMKKKLFTIESELSPEQQRFLSALGEHLDRAGGEMRLVGENKWFAALANDAGFHIDTRVTSPFDMPTDEELQQHADAALSLAYRRIILTVMQAKWLLEPRPGESALPGL